MQPTAVQKTSPGRSVWRSPSATTSTSPSSIRTTPRRDGRAGARPRPACTPTMNIVCSCASSRLSTSIFTVMPLYRSAAVAMLAETVGAVTREPAPRESTSMSSAERWKRLRLRGSRRSSSSGSLVGRVAEEERVRRLFGAARPRRRHLDPARALVRAPGVWHADRDDAACIRLELDPAPVQVEDGVAREHVEAVLERVEVRVDVAVLELDQPEPVWVAPVSPPIRVASGQAARCAPAAPAAARSPRGG